MTHYYIHDWSGSSFCEARRILNLTREEVGKELDMAPQDIAVAEITDSYCPEKLPLYRFYNQLFKEQKLNRRFMSDYGVLKLRGKVK